MSILGNGDVSEQVFQELLVALDERQDRFRGHNELLAWCWTASRNRLTNLMNRGDGRRLSLPNALLDKLDEQLRVRDSSDLSDQAEALEICLSELSRWDRWITHLFYTQDKGGLETARLMNLKPEHLYRELQMIYAGGAKCLLKRIAMGRTPLGKVQARNVEFERLVFRYLDDELSEEGIQQLGEALISDPDLMRQFNDIRLYSALVRDSTLMGSVDSETFSVNRPPLNPRVTRSLLASLVIASVILGVMLISLALIKLNPLRSSEAILVRGAGAKFATRKTPAIGEGLDAEKYVLTAGTIQLRFAKGADVNIEAPASFQVDSENRIILNQGTLLAMVPQAAKGFEVATKLGVVRDLGTEFGVIVKQGEAVQVVVFQGQVEVSRDGEPVYPLVGGDGLLITPGRLQPLVASAHAYRYPHTLASSDAVSSPESLAMNYSFEVGSLSRAPHDSHRYRDLPSYWTDGGFFNHRWKPQVEVPGSVNAGTAVTPFEGSEDIRPPNGERCLFLNGAAVRQRINNLLPGGQYKLKLKAASPDQSPGSLTATFEVGFLSGNQWIASEHGSVEPDSEFTELEYVLSIPEDRENSSAPIYLTLSSINGLIFFDEIRLLPLFGAD